MNVWVQYEPTGKYSLAIEGVVNKANVTGTSTLISSDFVPTTYHQLLVTKSGSLISVALDGVSIFLIFVFVGLLSN